MFNFGRLDNNAFRTHPDSDSGRVGMCTHSPIVVLSPLAHRPIAFLAYSELQVDRARDPSLLFVSGSCVPLESVFVPRQSRPILLIARKFWLASRNFTFEPCRVFNLCYQNKISQETCEQPNMKWHHARISCQHGFSDHSPWETSKSARICSVRAKS